MQMMNRVEIILANHLPQGFDYAVPEGIDMPLGAYVMVPFAGRTLPGVVWRKGVGAQPVEKLKSIQTHYAHLPPMQDALREWVEWTARYTMVPRGALVKMSMPIAEALEVPNARERPPKGVESHLQQAVLSSEQHVAATTLTNKLYQGFSATLLDGITGSGKTEVYFDSIVHVLEKDGQALVLLPEISLSVQWLERFAKRFGFMPQVWHSGLTPAARKHGWRAIVHGEAKVIVGARSALFLPYHDLQLMVVDEEHDHSYKQEEGVIYHARDMAVMRAYKEQIPITLVSATPSLESYHNVMQGKYAAVHLHARHGGAALPDIHMIDMRKAPLERGAFLAKPLREALAAAYQAGHQSLLFLNRRGYAPLTLCRACGHRFQCPQCTTWLVMHNRGKRDWALGISENNSQSSMPARLTCHHCSYTTPVPPACPACQATESLHACGPGVERIAEEVAAYLPQARVMILASDSAESYTELQAHITAMQEGKVDILIGTQMVAKGHHFGKLTLVGVVDADLGLSGGDVRAAERTYQLLHQLAGRAGRERIAGQVMVQSFLPDHPVMQALIKGDREAFLQLELQERKFGRLPPFYRLAALILESPKEELVAAFARQLARAAPHTRDIEVLGPAPAPLYRLRGKYRHRLLVRSSREVNIQAWIQQWLAPHKIPNSIRLKIDIDPYSFL